MFKFIEGTDNKAIITSDGKVFKRRKICTGFGKKKHTIGWSEFKESSYFFNQGYVWTLIPPRWNVAVHKLVARAFIPNPENKPVIDHINGNRADNRIENLRWVTQKENVNNPNTRYKNVYSSNRKVWSYIQGFNPKTNHRTPVFMNLRETSTWTTPEGKKINPGSLLTCLNKKITYRNYFWTAKLVTGEEYRELLE